VSDREKMGWILIVFLIVVVEMVSLAIVIIVGNKVLPIMATGLDWFIRTVMDFIHLITG